ncbi:MULTISPECIES: hypothetical protein [unclassified Streptomyces]|uniref:hypothetical protein n=1 Tax=unclassified Streptomyces TaxID=2593676 RepID=UPI0036E53890
MAQTVDATSAVAAPRQFTLSYPQTWWKLDLDAQTRDANIRRVVEAQVQGDDNIDRELLDSLIRSTRTTAREAHAQGALQVAGMIQFTDAGAVLSATTLVMRVTPPEDSSTDLGELLIPVALKNADNPMGRGTRANRVEMIQIDEIGPAGRATSIEDIDYWGRGTVRTATMNTIVPVPHSRDFLVVSSLTPNLSLTEAFFDLFDAVAGTLRFLP